MGSGFASDFGSDPGIDWFSVLVLGLVLFVPENETWKHEIWEHRTSDCPSAFRRKSACFKYSQKCATLIGTLSATFSGQLDV